MGFELSIFTNPSNVQSDVLLLLLLHPSNAQKNKAEIKNENFYIKYIDNDEYIFNLETSYFKNISKTSENFVEESGIREKFVDPDDLQKICKKYSLEMIPLIGDNAIFNFSKIVPENVSKDIAELYFAFSFRKI